jgi:glycosyltransferase involved in cell wall biosynthesis
MMDMEPQKNNVVVSLIIPAYNEEESIGPLYERIAPVMKGLGFAYEIVFVDDGSHDGTWQRLLQIKAIGPHVALIKLRRNCGQTPALAAGIDHARGDIIITMDADLQNDPRDIPRLLAKMDEGYEIVSGWRRDRKDKAISRKLPSLIANRIIGWVTGVRIHDYGCTLKAYHSGVLKAMHLYSDMHRFLPALGLLSGARVAEIVVTHHERKFGTSKYGISRVGKVIIDILTINLITRFSARPMHLFGSAAVTVGIIAILMTIFSVRHYMIYRNAAFFNLSLPTATFLLWWLAASMIGMGLLCENIVRASSWRLSRLQRVLADYNEHKETS